MVWWTTAVVACCQVAPRIGDLAANREMIAEAVSAAAAEVVRVQANASVNRMFIAACDRTGEERGVGWVGGSVIVDADGWPLDLADSPSDPLTIVAQCRLTDASEKSISRYSSVHADRRPEIYGRLT